MRTLTSTHSRRYLCIEFQSELDNGCFWEKRTPSGVSDASNASRGNIQIEVDQYFCVGAGDLTSKTNCNDSGFTWDIRINPKKCINISLDESEGSYILR